MGTGKLTIDPSILQVAQTGPDTITVTDPTGAALATVHTDGSGVLAAPDHGLAIAIALRGFFDAANLCLPTGLEAATAAPWRKYGHNRLYLNSGDTKIGYLDIDTGRIELEAADFCLQALYELGVPVPAPAPEVAPAVALAPSPAATGPASSTPGPGPIRVTIPGMGTGKLTIDPSILQVAQTGPDTITVTDPTGAALATVHTDGSGVLAAPDHGLAIAIALRGFFDAANLCLPTGLEAATAAPWRKYGHNRLYLNSGDTKIGYLDIDTGRIELEAADFCLQALYELGVPVPAPAPEVAPAVALAPSPLPPQPPAPEHLEAPWCDLAQNQPGEDLASIAEATAQGKGVFTRLVDTHLDRKTPERSWRKGAEGEIRVARELAKLPDGWRVLHSIPIGSEGADVDHLVIGPAGIFALNTKNISGNVWVGARSTMVDGQKNQWLRNARTERRRVAARLSEARLGAAIDITSVIVVIAPHLTVREQPDDVTVVAHNVIAAWLAQQPPIQDPTETQAWFEIARRSTTWLKP